MYFLFRHCTCTEKLIPESMDMIWLKFNRLAVWATYRPSSFKRLPSILYNPANDLFVISRVIFHTEIVNKYKCFFVIMSYIHKVGMHTLAFKYPWKQYQHKTIEVVSICVNFLLILLSSSVNCHCHIFLHFYSRKTVCS